MKMEPEIDCAEAAIVRNVFTLAEAGHGATDVAWMLNEDRFDRRNGRPWTQRRGRGSRHECLLYREGPESSLAL